MSIFNASIMLINIRKYFKITNKSKCKFNKRNHITKKNDQKKDELLCKYIRTRIIYRDFSQTYFLIPSSILNFSGPRAHLSYSDILKIKTKYKH